MNSARDPRLDTFPKLLAHNVRSRGARPAMREKDFGIWQSWSWAEMATEIRRLAAGFASLGVARGDKLVLVGDNRPQLYWSICAAQMLGATPVPVYQDAVADEMAYVIGHAEAWLAVVEDQEQVDKLLAIRAKTGLPRTIAYNDPRGLRGYGDEGLVALADVSKQGDARIAAAPGFLDAEIAKGKGSDHSVMLYTSGTTGQPKGVLLSYDNVIKTAQSAVDFDRLTESDDILAYLPMAWVGDHVFSYAQAYVAGFCVSCPESGATVMTDLREIGPSFFFAPPRIFENILTQVSIRMEDASALKRAMYRYFMRLAKTTGIALMDKKPVAFGDRLLYALGELLVYGPLKNTLGFTKMRVGYTAGEAIGPDIFDFYRSLGLNLKQLYGMTEASVFVCMQPDGQIKADTVGVPAPGVEIKIAENGEVLVKSPGIFQSYFKNDTATQSAKTPDGYYLTGDAGFFDKDGHLKIIDRAKDVGRLSDGTLFAPKYIENKLKFFSYVKEAVAFGHGRDFVSCILCIDLDAVGNWAERKGIAYASYQELAAKPEVQALALECVEQVNRDLAEDTNLAGSQIRRFLLLHKELDADDGELTRTRKVRRSFIADRYAPLVDGLYSGAERAFISSVVTFEDGRTGKIEADLAIRDVPRFAAHRPVTVPTPALQKAG